MAYLRVQTESEGWEALLEKHRSRAQELDRWKCLSTTIIVWI